MSPNRRVALHILASAGLAGLAGCLGDTGGGTDTTTTTSEPSTTTESPETSTTTEEPTTEDPPTDSTKTERVVIENRTDSTKVATIEVLDDGDSTIVSGTYEVPAMTGVRLDHEFDWATYTVRGTVEGGEWHSMTWEPDSCAATPAPDGDMNAGLVISAGEVEIVHNTCDYLRLGSVYVDTYEPASEYARVEE